MLIWWGSKGALWNFTLKRGLVTWWGWVTSHSDQLVHCTGVERSSEESRRSKRKLIWCSFRNQRGRALPLSAQERLDVLFICSPSEFFEFLNMFISIMPERSLCFATVAVMLRFFLSCHQSQFNYKHGCPAWKSQLWLQHRPQKRPEAGSLIFLSTPRSQLQIPMLDIVTISSPSCSTLVMPSNSLFDFFFSCAIVEPLLY